MSRPENRGGRRSALRHFLDNEMLGGLVLVGAAALTLAGLSPWVACPILPLAKLGILAGSFASGHAGYALLRSAAAPGWDVSVRDYPSD